MKLVLASNNKHKIEEIKSILSKNGIDAEVLSLSEIGYTDEIIEDGVSFIGMSAFENCTSLETVQIGNGVTLIDKFAFNNCTSLKNLTLGNKVQTIEMCAFQNCSSLTSIVIPASAKLIKESSFWDCYNLTNVEFKNPNNWGPDIDDPGCTYDLTDKQATKTLLLHGLGFRKH